MRRLVVGGLLLSVGLVVGIVVGFVIGYATPQLVLTLGDRGFVITVTPMADCYLIGEQPYLARAVVVAWGYPHAMMHRSFFLTTAKTLPGPNCRAELPWWW